MKTKLFAKCHFMKFNSIKPHTHCLFAFVHYGVLVKGGQVNISGIWL